MIWNGKETGKWQIPNLNEEEYKKSFDKLVALGFVFIDDRIKSADEIFARFEFTYPYIVIGHPGYGGGYGGDFEYSKCKMKLTGISRPNETYTTISVDDWIANCWPAYDAA